MLSGEFRRIPHYQQSLKFLFFHLPLRMESIMHKILRFCLFAGVGAATLGLVSGEVLACKLSFHFKAHSPDGRSFIDLRHFIYQENIY